MTLTRRELMLGAAGAVLAPVETPMLQTRLIPSSREQIPVVGLGTWQTFDVGTSPADRAPLLDVLRKFHALGGRVIDSSPMYGRSESVVGDLTQELGLPFFLATKVWTSGKREGEAQMASSLTKMRTKTMDLMQVHNLLDVTTHLKTLRAMKDAGSIRYIGITHYVPSAFDALMKIIRSEPIDFVQLPYSLSTREAEDRLLPLCAEKGVATLINRPFEEGALFSRVRGKEVPAWLAEAGFSTWAQAFMGYILGHPAVTCVIPATSKLKHLEDNMAAGMRAPPDEKLRKRMAKELL